MGVLRVGERVLSGNLELIRTRSADARVITLGVLCGIKTESRGPRRAKFTRLFRRLVFNNSIGVPSCSTPLRLTKKRGGT